MRKQTEKLSDKVARAVIERADAEWCRLHPERDPSGLTQMRRIEFKEGFVAGWIARSLEVTEC